MQPRLTALPMLPVSLVAWIASRSPPGQWELALVAGEREHAAAIGRVPVDHGEPVRDREAAGRRGVAPPTDRHGEPAQGAAVLAREERALGEVDRYGPRDAAQLGAPGRQPAHDAVVEFRRQHAQPPSPLLYDAQHPRRLPRSATTGRRTSLRLPGRLYRTTDL